MSGWCEPGCGRYFCWVANAASDDLELAKRANVLGITTIHPPREVCSKGLVSGAVGYMDTSETIYRPVMDLPTPVRRGNILCLRRFVNVCWLGNYLYTHFELGLLDYIWEILNYSL